MTIRVHVNVDRLRAGESAIVLIGPDVNTEGPRYCRELRGDGFRILQAREGEPRPDGCPHVWLEITDDMPLQVRE